MRAGKKRIRFRRATPGRCNGPLIAARTLKLAPRDDRSIVITKKKPRIVVFDDKPYGDIFPSAPDGHTVFRHAANLGMTDFYRSFDDGLPINPAAPFTKGDEQSSLHASSILTIWATKPGDPNDVLAATRFRQRSRMRHETYLLGTKRGNARFVTIHLELADFTF